MIFLILQENPGGPRMRPGADGKVKIWVGNHGIVVIHLGNDNRIVEKEFLAVRPASNPQAVLYPTGAGEPRRLPAEGLNVQTGADWLPDGRRVLLTANEPGRGSRLYLQDLSGGKPRAISPEGYRAFGKAVSPDGKTVAVLGPDQRIYLYPVEGGEPAAIPGLSAGESPAGWSVDGRSLYVYRQGELPAKVYLVEVATGRRQLWKMLMPSDSAGVSNITRVCPTPDGTSYAYAYIRTLSDLYLVEGAR